MRIEQIPNDKLLDHIREEDLYMVTFSEKQSKPNIAKVSSAKLSDIFAASCYVRFVEDEESQQE